MKIMTGTLHCCLVLILVQNSFGWSPMKPKSTKTKPKPLRYDVTLDQSRHLHLYWDIDPVTSVITFRLKSKLKPEDFVGFGFSDYGEIENADVIMMWSDEHRRHHFTASTFIIMFT